MKKAIKEVAGGLKSLAVGMRITLGQFFKPTVTVHYPRETLPIPPRFRGHIELVRDPNTGKPLCFSCKLCERACPSDCITVEGVKPEGSKKKTVSKYILDFTKCSLCGSCVEACRDGAIRFSREYNLAGLSKEDFIMDLFARLQEEAKRDGIIIERPVEGPATPVAAKPATAPAPTASPEGQPAPAPAASVAKPAPAAAPAGRVEAASPAVSADAARGGERALPAEGKPANDGAPKSAASVEPALCAERAQPGAAAEKVEVK